MGLTRIRNRAIGTDVETGAIVQVKQTTFTGTNSYAHTANVNLKITDLAVDITPVYSNSIIKLEAFVTGENQNTASNYNTGWFFYRDDTVLAAATAGSRLSGIQMGTNITIYTSDAGSTAENAAYMYFDSPSTTSQITYTVGYVSAFTSYWHLNKTVGDTDTGQHERGISTICATEIKA